jgi:regulator of protease activity HflC (stomatin/prohibitin superfamily)
MKKVANPKTSFSVKEKCHPLAKPQESERGAIGSWIFSSLGLIVLVLIVAAVAVLTFGKTVPPGYMGLRQTYFGPTKGYEENGFAPGVYLTVPLLSTVHLLPEGVRLLHLEGRNALAVTTVEGALVDLEVSIVTRINRISTDSIQGPGGLARSLAIADTTRWDKHIESVSEEALLDSFSKLMASEFYIPEKRLLATEQAFERIKPKLARVGIVLDSLLLHNFNYQRDEIEKAIFAKNIQVKEKELNRALSSLAKVEAELSETEAKLKADVDVLLTKGEQLALRIGSEAALREAENKAKGDQLVALSEAKIKFETSKLLADEQAASRLIAEQMAPLLGSLKGGVISGVDPYDLEQWARRFGISKPQTKEKE